MRTTPDPSRATHLILDPSVRSNRSARETARSDQHVVSLGWVLDSLFADRNKLEGDYPVPQLEQPVFETEGSSADERGMSE